MGVKQIVITICGSMRFEKKMQEIARDLETKKGFCVLQPIYKVSKKKVETYEEIENILRSHLQKIDLSNAIYVVNIGGYIGESTKQEIEYAEKQHKKIFYHE